MKLPSSLIESANHGVVDSRLIKEAGLSHTAVQARVRSGLVRRVCRGIYVIPECVDEWTAIAAAQRRWPTVVLGGGSALHLYRCDGNDEPPTTEDLRSTHGGCRSPYPRARRVAPSDMAVVSGIRVFHPVPLLGRSHDLPADRIEAAVETFLRRRAISVADLRQACAGHGPTLTERERRRLSALMTTRGWDAPATESYLETLTVQRVLRPAGLGHVRQVVVELGGAYLKRFDFQLESGLLINCHGMAFHTSKAAVQQDAAYGLRLRLAGLEVETITWDDVTRRPHKTARDLAARSAQVQAARRSG